MPSATFTLADGRKVTISGPTREAVLQRFEQIKTQPQTPPDASASPAPSQEVPDTSKPSAEFLAGGKRVDVDRARRNVAGLGEGLARTWEGLGEFGNELAVKTGLVEPEYLDQYRRDVDANRAARGELSREHLGGEMPEGAILAGQVAAGAAMPAARGATLVGSLIKGALVGGGSAAATAYKGEGSAPVSGRLGDFKLGAVLGGALAAAPALVRGARNHFASYLRRVFETQAPTEAAHLEADLAARLGDEFHFSLGEATAQKDLVRLEQKAWGDIAQSERNQRLDKLGRLLTDSADNLAPDVPAERTVEAIRGTLKATRKTIETARTEGWKAAAYSIEQEFGDKVVIGEGRNLLDAMDSLIKQTEDVVSDPTGKTIAPKFRQMRAQISAMMDRGGMTAKELTRTLRGINEILGGRGAIFENAPMSLSKSAGVRLMGALMDDADNVLLPRAVDRVQAMRNQWSLDSARLDRLRASVLAKTFGAKDFTPGRADEALDNLLARKPSAQREVRDMLEELAPDVLKQVQARAIRNMVAGATDLRQGAISSDLSADRIAELGGRYAHILGDKEMKDVLLASRAARFLLHTDAKSPPMLVDLPALSINVVSRSPFFIARLVAQVIQGGTTAERMFATKAGRDALTHLAFGPKATSGPTEAKTQAAVAMLVASLREDDTESDDNAE